MIVNGVTLPDIPADVLAKYPYAMVFTIGAGINYGAILTKAPMCYIPAGMTEYGGNTYGEMIYSDSVYTMGVCKLKESGEWEFSETGNAGPALSIFTADWTNHNIYTATSCVIDEEAETITVTVGSEIYLASSIVPERVSIGRSLMDGYAREVQRLTGTTDQMNGVQIREKLSTVKAGIKIGDTILPPIPEDVLASYPYATIGFNSSDSVYVLVMAPTASVYIPVELNTEESAAIRTSSVGYKYYIIDTESNAWVLYAESSTATIKTLINETQYVLWCNHDIYIATAYDGTANGITVGTEVYFSEQQNFNGVWLPKIPEDVLDLCPYAAIASYSSSKRPTYTHCLVLSSSPFGQIDGSLIGEPVDKMLGSFGEGVAYWLNTNVLGAWSFQGSSSVGSTGLYDGEVQEGGRGSSGLYNLLWTNHDIYEWTDVNLSTGEYTTGGLYFPPLPAIDSDRVSIGYDLFDSIVAEVQRLSGDQDKMDALHAYWKLTTVV